MILSVICYSICKLLNCNKIFIDNNLQEIKIEVKFNNENLSLILRFQNTFIQIFENESKNVISKIIDIIIKTFEIIKIVFKVEKVTFKVNKKVFKKIIFLSNLNYLTNIFNLFF